MFVTESLKKAIEARRIAYENLKNSRKYGYFDGLMLQKFGEADEFYRRLAMSNIPARYS